MIRSVMMVIIVLRGGSFEVRTVQVSVRLRVVRVMEHHTHLTMRRGDTHFMTALKQSDTTKGQRANSRHDTRIYKQHDPASEAAETGYCEESGHFDNKVRWPAVEARRPTLRAGRSGLASLQWKGCV